MTALKTLIAKNYFEDDAVRRTSKWNCNFIGEAKNK
jgi:hypothetical protein